MGDIYVLASMLQSIMLIQEIPMNRIGLFYRTVNGKGIQIVETRPCNFIFQQADLRVYMSIMWLYFLIFVLFCRKRRMQLWHYFTVAVLKSIQLGKNGKSSNMAISIFKLEARVAIRSQNPKVRMIKKQGSL